MAILVSLLARIASHLVKKNAVARHVENQIAKRNQRLASAARARLDMAQRMRDTDKLRQDDGYRRD